MHSGRRYVPIALAAVVLLLGLLATAGVSAVLTQKERRSAAQAMDRQVDLARAAVSGEVQRYLDTIDNLAAALGSHDQLTRAAFERATAHVPGENLAGATAVVYVVPQQGHYLAVYGRRLDGRDPAVAQPDLSAVPEIADVLRQSASLGGAAVSTAAVDPDGSRTLNLATPVLSPDGSLRGLVLLGLRGPEFFGGAIGTVVHPRVTATLSATQEGGGLLPLATVHPTAPGTDALVRTADVGIAQRRWRLDLAADPRELPGAYTDRPLVSGAAGVLLSVLVAILVHVLGSRRAKAMELVEEATRDLRQAGAAAHDLAARQRAILHSVSEGVTVVGADGRILLQNPAARELLGTADDAVSLAEWPAHYGAYLPDRVTPFPAADLPMLRAIRGEPVDGVELVIRNPAHPDGILVSVSARPLHRPGAGPVGAVAVLHDITALRRYETELAQFAAVVAHDLKSPLTAVHGFAAVAADAVSATPPRVETAGAALQRVRQGAVRMREIIDVLLAYTTARDAPLDVADVDLQALVAAVVAERTAPRPVAFLSPAVLDVTPPAPSVWVGPLPPVRADPGLLRLVVDNLVGNAIKYTPAGVAAQVEISAGPATGGVRLVVADRGIGIPDDEKGRVFESFHRGRPLDYGGTGLGLAICRRIVERHGGTIAVQDNPGGGTRFCVTLPAAPDGWQRLQRPSTPAVSAPAAVPAAVSALNHKVK
ncbi:PAS domain-containing protein [Dactylosporangium vinaceum]|uniref:Sensor-like histidine kinase SenX3 n=1 Tax=Dactylosporangium vinaceum TaxID=53362 RepID=A0ABV5MMJ7_9ACTN|nr:PAS domain-containing protein [Dactylosporangium vinaceum]